MTRYAVDEANTMLVRTWATGRGEWAAAVTPLPADAGTQRHQCLATELAGLSHELWRCYTHPADAAHSSEVNTPDWRRQKTRESFSTVIASVRSPNLPDEDGSLLVNLDPVEERAHRVGRALHEIGDDAVRRAVLEDIEAELEAVENAECGQVADRAGQATVLSRSDASHAQIARADAILRENPLDAWTRLRELEPTAAAVAAAHWLKAAVDAIAKLTRMPARRVLLIANDEEGFDHPAAAEVLSLLNSADAAYDVVTSMVDRSMQIADGYLLAPGENGAGDDEPLELTSLDPQRPAPELLEQLLNSIRSCGQLYGEFAEAASAEDLDDAAKDALFCDAARSEAKTHRIAIH